MWQRSGHAQCKFTDDRFSHDAVPKDFIGCIQDITDYLSHLPETQVNRAYCQNISVVKNGSFMRNKRHVFCVCVRTFTDSKNILTTYHIFAPKIGRPIFFNFPGSEQPLFSNFHSMGPPIIKKRCCRPRGGREHFWNSPKRLIEIIEVEMYFYHLTVLLQYYHRLTTISKNFTLTFDS